MTYLNIISPSRTLCHTLRQWPKHGKEVLENTLRILRGEQSPRCPEAKPTDKEGIAKPRRMRRVFSNTSEPCFGQ